MTFEIQSDGVDVAALMEAIRKRIEEKKKGLYTEEEIKEIAEHRLDGVLDAHDFHPDLVKDFRVSPPRARRCSSVPGSRPAPSRTWS